jgi:prophage antirepressor-like protein
MSIFTFDNQTFTLTNYGTTENIFFKAKEIASFLAYTNTRKAIRDHVWDANKFTLDENHRKKGGSIRSPLPMNR